MELPVPDDQRRRVVLVTTPACHYCEDAHQALVPLAASGSIDLETVGADSPRGVALVGAHRPAMFPLVLVDGEFLSSGRLPRGKLARTLGLSRATV